ncbi:thiamine phosphate synthase [Porcipelethomonas sp.]|uniref:thiamine phosphate synthase n=1 Tax=Porcipelethomonas sp. TaxID=2981675 RepID=UPI003EF82112
MVIAVTNRKLCTDDFIIRVREILRAEPFEVILREKDLNDAEYEQIAADIVAENSEYKKNIALNRPDIALKLGIENVHLTMSQLAESGKPEGFKRVGVSVHSPDEGVKAERLGADYLIAGHVYETDCKKGIPPRGIEFFREVCKSVNVPVFAIGGISEHNFIEPLKNGGYGVCLMSEFMRCRDPFKQVNKYKRQL